MTRRDFITSLGIAATGTRVTAEGFEVSGTLTEAGTGKEKWYAVENVALMLDPDKHPAMCAGADALLNSRVRLSLVRAD